MLKDIVGSVVKLEDIPPDATIRKLKYGMYPLYVIDTIFRDIIHNLYDSEIILCDRVISLETVIPWKTMDEALENFSFFNILDEIEEAAKKPVDLEQYKSAAKKKKHIERVKKYIDQVSNNCFREREYQKECIYVINGVKSELRLLAAQLNIDHADKSDHSLRSNKSLDLDVAVRSEAEALQTIKHLFEELYRDLGEIIWAMRDRLPVVKKPDDFCDIDI